MMTPTDVTLPKVVSRDEWLVARKALLAKEKELTRHRDAVNAERRRPQRRPVHGLGASPRPLRRG